MAFFGLFGKSDKAMSDKERAQQEKESADNLKMREEIERAEREAMRERNRPRPPQEDTSEDEKTIFDKMSDKYAKYSDMSKFKRKEEQRLQKEYDEKTREEEKKRFVVEAEEKYKRKLEESKLNLAQKTLKTGGKVFGTIASVGGRIAEDVNKGAAALDLSGTRVTDKITAMTRGDMKTSAGSGVHDLAAAINIKNPWSTSSGMQQMSTTPRLGLVSQENIRGLATAELPGRQFMAQQGPMTVEDLLGVRANLGSFTPQGQAKFQQFTSLGSSKVLVDELSASNINTSKIETMFPRSAMSSGAFDSSKITALIMANQPGGVSTSFASKDRLRGLIAANTPGLRQGFNPSDKLGLMLQRPQPQVQMLKSKRGKKQMPIIEDSTTRMKRLTGVNLSGRWL